MLRHAPEAPTSRHTKRVCTSFTARARHLPGRCASGVPRSRARANNSRVDAWPRLILHVDMDAFYAAIEQLDDPSLRGRPVLVGGRGKRGVVTTASYEARTFGCRSAMPMAQALRLCPHAAVVPVRIPRYASVSRQVRDVLERFSPDIEPISIDEAFVDLTRVAHWNHSPTRALEAARGIKAAIREQTGLAASVGLAANKFLAKIASDLRKPDGLCAIPPEDAARILAPLPVSVLMGVGRVSSAKLEELGVRTVADLLVFDVGELSRRFGASAEHWRRLAVGEDPRIVRTQHAARSIGRERTFGEDIADAARLRAVLAAEVEHAARALREEALVCRRVALKIRLPNFTTFSRSRVLAEPTSSTATLRDAASGLLDAFMGGRTVPLRLLGVRLEELSHPAQPGLFDESPIPSTPTRIDALTDRIARKFGAGSITRAGAIDARDKRSGAGARHQPGSDSQLRAGRAPD